MSGLASILPQTKSNIAKTLRTYGRKKKSRTPLQKSTNSIFTTKHEVEHSSESLERPGAWKRPRLDLEENRPTANSTQPRDQGPAQIKNNQSTLELFINKHGSGRAIGEDTAGSQHANNAPLQQERDSETISARRKALDDAIAANDRAEEVYNRRRQSLHNRLWQAQVDAYSAKVEERSESAPLSLAARTRLKKVDLAVESAKNEIEHLNSQRERVWWTYYSALEGISMTEKEQMRQIKRQQLNDPNYAAHATDKSSMSERWQPDGCIYCADDDCPGCVGI